jgi:hypothetical protein
MAPGLGKRKSVENKGSFSQWRLDLQGLSGLRRAGSGDRRMTAGLPDFFVRMG